MLEKVIEEVQEKTGLISFFETDNSDVENYFKNVLKCEYVPKQVIEFYEKYDGASFDINEMFSLENIKNEAEEFANCADEYEIDYNVDKYIPIADDGMGGYYAFLSSTNSEKIYWIDTENVGNEWKSYNDLSSFLKEMLESVLYNEQ